MNKKKYFITGGGTGGHIYPAVAVADALITRDDTQAVYYVGNPAKPEAGIVSDKKYEFLPVNSSGMPRKIGINLIIWIVTFIKAWIRCCFYIAKYKPDIIFGTGGYVTAPVLMAGITMRVPFVLHDCDACPGLVTRKFSPFARSVSVAFDTAKEKINNTECFVNGNPIRKGFFLLSKKQARVDLCLENKMTICIMGGSQGAKTINNAAVPILKYLSHNLDTQIIFQTGKNNYEETLSRLNSIYPEYKYDKNIIIKPYFDNMVTVLKSCDIAVSRAGSLSISELCASSAAAILVPYPHAASDHQRINAKYIVQYDAGMYLEDSETTPETLLKLLEILIKNPARLEQIQINSSKLAKFDGVEKIVNQLIS